MELKRSERGEKRSETLFIWNPSHGLTMMNTTKPKRRRVHGGGRGGSTGGTIIPRRPPPMRLDWLGDGIRLASPPAMANDVEIKNNNAASHRMAMAMASTAGLDCVAVSDAADHSPSSCSTSVIDLTGINNESCEKRDDDVWICQACTLINSGNIISSLFCNACHTKRGIRRSKQQRSVNEPLKEAKQGSARSSSSTSTYSNNAVYNRSAPPPSSSTSTMDTTAMMLWIDKYAPRTSHELCVAPKKVEQVRSFLSRSFMDDYNMHTTETIPRSTPFLSPCKAKLMILIGNPGVGKSAMVRTLAKEMNVQIISWNDAHAEFHNNNNLYHHQLVVFENGCFEDGTSGYDTLPYQSQLNSFDEFLTISGRGVHSLNIEEGDAGSNFMMTNTVGAAAAMQKEKGRSKKRTKNCNTSKTDDSQRKDFAGSVILVEEIPNLHNSEASASFRTIMEKHIHRTQIPTIFIYSDVHEGNHKPEELERLFPAHLLNSPYVEIVQIHPVTKSKMKKCLLSIAKAEQNNNNPFSSLFTFSDEDFEDMHLSSGGDLRHAIFAMQFRSYCSSNRSSSSARRNDIAKKDTPLSTFHALGKLLYAKRKQQSLNEAKNNDLKSKWNDERGPLEFVPEEVLSRIEMGISPALSFLSFHSPDFFTDITDLSRSYHMFSDAVVLVDRFASQQGDGPFPTEYASCIGGRAVADANKHPAPPQFRQLTTPKVFQTLRKCRENETKIELLKKRIVGKGQTSIHNIIGSAHQFITDSLPYMRDIIPQDINFALANLHSLSNNSAENAESQPPEEENFVLLEDDLVDDDDPTS